MSYFKFNNISSESLPILLVETPFRPSWVETIEEINVPGRATPICRHNGAYHNQILTINAVITDTSRLQEVYSALHGRGKLILSTNPNEYVNAYVTELIPQPVAMTMASLPISFSCLPFAYSITDRIIDLSDATEYKTVLINGTADYCEPIVTFTPTASGTVIIDTNGIELKIIVPSAAKTVVVDSSLMLIYYLDENNQKTNLMPQTFGDLPLLHKGTNYIKYSGEVSAININVNERWL